MQEVVTPYKNEGSKKEQVAEMFDNISHKYDFLNHFLSVGIDVLWRKKAIRLLRPIQPKTILDVATGTGDFAIEALSLQPQKIVGVDISSGMLEQAKIKIKKKRIDHIISLQKADSEDLPFDDESFNALTVGFGVRNYENLEKGLLEMNRVLTKGGMAAILEFSKPTAFPIKQIYSLYFLHILPAIGKLVSKDARAYTYLPESVKAFPDGADFIKLMEKTGYKNIKQHKLSFGIASIYLGSK